MEIKNNTDIEKTNSEWIKNLKSFRQQRWKPIGKNTPHREHFLKK